MRLSPPRIRDGYHAASGGLHGADRSNQTDHRSAAGLAVGRTLSLACPSVRDRPRVTVRAGLGAIIFDCDGVLLESVDVKTQAYRLLFTDYPEHVDAVVGYHLANGGVSRYDKIRYVYRNILRKPLAESELAVLCARFASLSLDEVLNVPLVNGVREFLEAYHARLRLFVASGTPQQELEAVLDHKGLRRYFRAVFGSPLSKVEIMGRILSEWRLAPSEVIAVGDAPGDCEAAEAWGVQFIARRKPGDEAPVPMPAGVEEIGDIADLLGIMKGRLEGGTMI
ncbi:MAG: HAD family hydrolase [Nitrospirae bacterium]|nr:MAG: HAD family hydrolase [Nitrospirota bacterium]